MTPFLEYRMAELERLIRNMIRIGTVKTLAGSRVVVQSGDLVTAPLPWVTRRAGNDRDWWAPEPGEQVLLVCPCGDPALGVVIPAIYRDDFPEPGDGPSIHRTCYADTAVVEYDRAGHALSATIPGAIRATAPDITLTGPVRIDGTLHVTGAVTSDTSIGAPDMAANGSIAAPSVLAGGVEVTQHDHACPHGGRTSELGE